MEAESITTMHQPSLESLAQLYLLDGLKGFGPQKFKQLHELKIPVPELLKDPVLLPVQGKRGEPLRQQLRVLSARQLDVCRERAAKQLEVARSTDSFIITYGHPNYPRSVFKSNNPVPVLYVRGNVELLRAERTVACVGSRGIREPYLALHRAFARIASDEHFTVVSGFALGADTAGQLSAVESGGSTIGVMPSGLDRPFPPENRELWKRFLHTTSAVFVSEFPFGTGAASLNLRKRNKLIVAFALGVLLSQTSATGGAMNAYRFAVEQKKPIATIADDSTPETSGNKTIASASASNNVVFPSDREDIEGYLEWLRRLSSLT